MAGYGRVRYSMRGKCDGFADMLEAAHPGNKALDAHAKSGVGHGAVAAQIQIPFEVRFRQPVLLQTLPQQFQVVDALPAPNHFAKTLGRDEIRAESNFRTIWCRSGSRKL